MIRTNAYTEEIRRIVAGIPTTLLDFSCPRDKGRMPTQASSDFITKKEQGDWAESLIMKAINGNATNHVAVKYGKSDDIIAGDEHFAQFYEAYQDELDTIGKRPDLLIFSKDDYRPELGTDISQLPHNDIDDYVAKAVAGIEVRSSAFLIDRYEAYMESHTAHYTGKALALRDGIIADYGDLLQVASRKPYHDILSGFNADTIKAADFKVPGWRASARLAELNERLKELKGHIREVQKRDYLSITPKVEDLKVVYKWVETFGVPHFYFQVFFDKIYGISFKEILTLISNPDREGEDFSVESDAKNQNKTTIKIRSRIGAEVASKVDEPAHRSLRKEMARGRLLFYVAFSGGMAYLDVDNIKTLLGVNGTF